MRRVAPIRLILLIVIVSLTLVACQDAPPNIVLITLDHTRADDFGIYGNEVAPTPNLDQFAREAVLYEQAYATSSDSLSSHASLLTGLYPMQHGARPRLSAGSPHLQSQPLSDRATTLAESLRARGYTTAAIVTNPVLRRELGLAQGFEHYDDTLAESGSSPIEHGVDLAIARLETLGDEPFLLFVDLFDSAASASVKIADRDHQLGRLLSALDAAPRGKETLIAITADTGRERRATTEGRENVPHALHLYEETVRVPLILRYPLGAELAAAPWRGTRIDIAVQNHRLFATFLEASGARLPENRRLHSLGDRNTLIFTEARHPPTGEKPSDGQHRDFRALYLFPFKLIQDASGISEYYNLDDDPNEEHNIREKAPKSYSRLLKMIIQFAEAHPPLFHDQEEDESNVWQASVDTLEELGTVE